jgi:hypothetical protein
VDQRADAGDDQDHQRRQVIEPQLQWNLQIAGGHPVEGGRLGEQRIVRDEADHRQHRDHERADDRQAGHTARDGLRQPPPQEGVDEEAKERK